MDDGDRVHAWPHPSKQRYEAERKVIEAAKAWVSIWASEMDDLIEYIPECSAFRDAVEALDTTKPYAGMTIQEADAATTEASEEHDQAVREAMKRGSRD